MNRSERNREAHSIDVSVDPDQKGFAVIGKTNSFYFIIARNKQGRRTEKFIGDRKAFDFLLGHPVYEEVDATFKLFNSMLKV